jgi:tetratricopeptide (TPR) repeat protein
MTPENIRDAAGLFEQAVQRDPRSTRAWGGVAFTSSVGAALGWMPDRDVALRRLAEATQRLRQIDEYAFFTMLARINLANRTGDWGSALTISDAMLERFPSHAPTYATRGQGLIGLGRFDECLEPLAQALRIGPRDPLVGSWHWMIANCHFMRADYPKAAESARTASQANPRLPMPPLTLAAALQRDGKIDEARKIIADYRSRNPNYQTAQVELVLIGTEPRFVEGRQRMIDSLRALGMP